MSATRTPLSWALIVGVLMLVAVNGYYVVEQWQRIWTASAGRDFTLTFEAVIGRANPYEVASYVWSPLAVPVLALIVPFGYAVWSVLHGIALLLIRPWWVAVLVGLSAPFWWDIWIGNVGVLLLALAWLAVRGNRMGTVAFLIATLLMPRPLMLPVLAWVLWHQPWTRLPFAALAVGQLVVVAGMGLFDDWVTRLVGVIPNELGKEDWRQGNIGPSRIIGQLWVPLGLALATWLTWRGRLGLASLAASPYIFPFYLLLGFLELRNSGRHDAIGDGVKRNERSRRHR